MKALAVPVVVWAPGVFLVGDGPSYLLFRAEERQVTHLTSASGLFRKVRKALKGYQVIKEGKLVVQALIDFRELELDEPANFQVMPCRRV